MHARWSHQSLHSGGGAVEPQRILGSHSRTGEAPQPPWLRLCGVVCALNPIYRGLPGGWGSVVRGRDAAGEAGGGGSGGGCSDCVFGSRKSQVCTTLSKRYPGPHLVLRGGAHCIGADVLRAILKPYELQLHCPGEMLCGLKASGHPIFEFVIIGP